MKVHKRILNLLLFLIIIYFSQNVLYESGSIISQTSLFITLAISLIYFIKTLLQRGNKPPFYKAIILFLTLNIIGIIFLGDITNPHHFGQFKNTLYTTLPFFPFFYFSKKNILTERKLIVFFIFIIIISIADFYISQNQILSMRMSLNEDLVNNVAYKFVLLIPFVFFITNKKVLSMLVMLVFMFFIIQGAKRGALIAGFIGLIFFIYYQFESLEKKHRIRDSILLLIGVTILFVFIYNYITNNDYFIMRMTSMMEGDSSGRDIIYTNLFNAWYNSDNLFHIIFGLGYTSSIELSMTGNYAHNDWLELLTSFGLIGILIYASMFYTLISHAFNKSTTKESRILMLTIVSLWFFKSMVSMVYATSSGILFIMLVAFLIGKDSNNMHNKYLYNYEDSFV